MKNELNQQKALDFQDKGIEQSIDNADNKINNWSEQAYKFVIEYAKNNREFMVEDVRAASDGIVPDPPHTRAWGGIIRRVKNNGFIEAVGIAKTKNPKAHRAMATLWIGC